MVTDVKPEQPEKVYCPILVTAPGMATEVKPVQPEKAYSPISVTASGMVTEVKPVQPEKALLPMLSTAPGIATDVKPVQPEKAYCPILVTASGMVIEIILLISWQRPAGICSTLSPKINDSMLLAAFRKGKLFISQYRAFHVTDVKLVQSMKAYPPISVTASGMVIEAKPVQSSKAHRPILVTASGMVTEVKPEQPEKTPRPILVTDSGMVIEVSLLISWQRPAGICSTLSPKINDSMLLVAFWKGDLFISQYRAFHVTEVKPVQPRKADSPIPITDWGMVIEVSLLIPRQRPAGICSTLSPKVNIIIFTQLENGELSDMPSKLLLVQFRAFQITEIKPVQSSNAPSPILITASGMVTDVKPVQPKKAYSPIPITDSGMVIEVSLLIPWQRPAGICSTLSPKINDSMLLAAFRKGELSISRAFHVTEVKPVQPEKALQPILVTDLGMVTEVKPVQPEKAILPMLVTDSGMVTEVKPVKPSKA